MRGWMFFFSEECKECHGHEGHDIPVTAEVHPTTESPAAAEPLKERPMEEVAAILAQQDLDEKEILTCKINKTDTFIDAHAHTQESSSLSTT